MEISILLLTCNHKKYVKQTLDSIIKQKINVPYEIVIADDASIDGTQKILIEYKKKYPERISLYLKKRNSCHPTKCLYYLLSKARGKYFATIEGDDYWADELKIQKQYDFLENNKRYSACTTGLIVVDENDNEIADPQQYVKKNNNIYSFQDFMYLRMPGMTVSFFARNYFEEESYSIIYKADRNMGDNTLYMLSILKGDIYQFDEKMSVYRYISKNGGENFNSIHKNNFYLQYNILRHWIRLENYVKQKYSTKFNLDIIRLKPLLTMKYPIKTMFYLLSQSKNAKKYFLIYFANKYLWDSGFVWKEKRKATSQKKYSWKYFRKEDKQIVLFGAGAVAEEYIDKYAWQDNIIFLVDNDENKQNTSFKGFIIKNPKEIIKYKNQVNILITNKEHEIDIERQLQSMDIQSYYCYCSMQYGRIRHIIANAIFQKYC